MPRLYVFADEAGDFTFSRHPRASRYFIVCTITLTSCDLCDSLMALRREFSWRKYTLGDYFHATEDKQNVRNEVFSLIQQSAGMQIQATIMEKSKAQFQVRRSESRFYKYGWLYHFRYGVSQPMRSFNEILITAASIGTKSKRNTFK